MSPPTNAAGMDAKANGQKSLGLKNPERQKATKAVPDTNKFKTSALDAI
jgi:hypothetical protein